MNRAYTLFLLLSFVSLGLASPAFTESRDARDFDTDLTWRDTCPSTREEIATLKQCVQCPRESDGYVTKVCCPPGDRFDTAEGGCVITAIERTCRPVKNERDRQSCYKLLLPPTSPDDSVQAPPRSLPPASPPPPPLPPRDDSFYRCMQECRNVQYISPGDWDLIGCQYACGPNNKNPVDHNYQTGGCRGLYRYCTSLRWPFESRCKALYTNLCRGGY